MSFTTTANNIQQYPRSVFVAGVNIGNVDAPANGGVGTAAAADPGFIREVEYEDPTNGQKFRPTDFLIKGYSYGKQAVPITMYDDEYGASADVEMRKFREKDLSLLGFVDASSVPHHRLIDVRVSQRSIVLLVIVGCLYFWLVVIGVAAVTHHGYV